jgi:uncharacterized protein YbjT (DUF2867 family)
MKITVIGGNGMIGKKLVGDLQDRGHDVVAASRSTGIDVLTGEGLAEAFHGADVVVDVTNSPSFAPDDVIKFFETSTGHLTKAAKAAGVKHFVALSIVGADGIPDSGYMVAKVAQEKLVRASGVPYTIVRATQFFEFVESIAESCRVGDELRMPTQLLQPIAADDVALALADVAVTEPTNGTIEIAGPEALPMADWGRRRFHAEPREQAIVDDPNARYFGAALKHGSLVPQGKARLGAIHFEQWLGQHAGAH